MSEPFVSRGFRGRRQPSAVESRLPPGQYETRDFPVLSAGPTPRTALETWDFTIRDRNGAVARWSWDEFNALPHETITTDIHCVTKWSKFNTVWAGVSVDTVLAEANSRGVESAPYVLAVSDGAYTTNLPLSDLTGGKAWVAVNYDGRPLTPEHGGPARLLGRISTFGKAPYGSGSCGSPRSIDLDSGNRLAITITVILGGSSV